MIERIVGKHTSAKLDDVAAELIQRGWIDGKRIQEITNTGCARDYIYKLKKRRGIVTVAHHATPKYTRWLLASPRNAGKYLLRELKEKAKVRA